MTAAPKDIAPRARATASLSICGPGDTLPQRPLRRSAESLLACGLDEWTVDLSTLDEAYPAFVTVLAALTGTARARGCEPFIVGVHSPAVLVALDEAPSTSCSPSFRRHVDLAPATDVPPEPGHSAESRRCPSRRG